MQAVKAYKVRIYPNREQEQKLLQTIGACRWVYNYYLDLQINAYLQTGKNIPYVDLARDLTKLRNSGEYPWLKEVQSFPLQQSLRTLDTSYNRFFRKLSSTPRFKSRKDIRQSFRKPKDWAIKGHKIQVQGDIIVAFRGRTPSSNTILKSLVISKTPTDKWFASMVAEEEVAAPSGLNGSIGIDLGLTHTAITSGGQKFDNLTIAKKRAKRLKCLQQSLARKQKDSHHREKARLELARLYERIANQRMNHLHQVSSAITGKNHALIAVEDLSVVNMMKNHSLAGSISDVSWGELIRQLEYKQQWRGGQFVKIDRFFPSSKTCSNCLKVTDSLPLSIRHWTCQHCGAEHDRDINAAKNILKQAEVQLGVESTDGSRKVRVTGLMKRGHATSTMPRPRVGANALHTAKEGSGGAKNV
jgi:putative transposase